MLTGAFAAAYLIWQPPSADLATAVYRAGLFSDHGFVVYDPQWYAGYLPLGYSLLLGPLGAALGVRLLGAVAAIAAAVLFARLVGRERPAAALWFAGGVGVSLGSGRIAFTLGVALGLAALLAARRPGRASAAAALALAAASALASPLTGAFLALAALAGAPAPGRRSAPARLALAAAGLLPAGVLALAFPTPGYEPFAPSSFWPALALLLVLAALAPALRPGIGLYAAACVASFAVPTPVGGNVVRLGALFAGPLAAAALGPDRRRALGLLALPLAYWQLQAPIRDVIVAHGDPSTRAAYYAPLERFLAGRPGRVEVPFTREHWEAALLAPRVALARGWERQLDIAENGLFYRPGLSAAAYAGWLRATAVAYVALPDVRLDYSARAEAALIGAGQPFLRPVARLAHWRVYAVAGAPALASPPARLTALGPDGFTLRFARGGTSRVRLRFTDYWTAPPGGCVRPAPDGFTAVTAAGPGTLRIGVRLDLLRRLRGGGGCGEAAAGRPAGGAG